MNPRHERKGIGWPEFLAAITDGVTGVEIARVTGISQSKISRWNTGHRPFPDDVEIVAHAYGVPVLAALEAAGYIESYGPTSELTRPRALKVRDFSDLELTRELYRRASLTANKEEPLLETDRNQPSNPTGEPFDNGTEKWIRNRSTDTGAETIFDAGDLRFSAITGSDRPYNAGGLGSTPRV